MKVAARTAISRRMACCVGCVLLAAVIVGCSPPVASPGSTSALSRSRSASPPTGASPPGASRTVRAGHLVVSGSASETRLRIVARDARVAVGRVRSVWGSSVLTGAIQLEVPADEAGFRALGGSVEPGGQVAATTTAAGRVVLAPALFTQVTAEGVVVVLTHELTHVALHQAGDTDTARWVVEGAAEFTAYRPTGFALRRLAPQLAAAVRAGHTPAGPPTDARFRSAPQAAYQQAYVWCAFLVHRFGVDRFTGFVRSAHTGREAAFADAFGTSIASLQQPFQAFVRTRVATAGTSTGRHR